MRLAYVDTSFKLSILLETEKSDLAPIKDSASVKN